jgi:hypothetical protein
MKFHEMYPKDRIYAADFGGKAVTLTIKSVAPEVLGEGGPSEDKMPVWRFVETDKKFPANLTNGTCARAMFGDDSDEWIGHKITLYPVPDASGMSDDGLCIRVKGSPELERDLVFKARIGRKVQQFKLVPTKKAKAEKAPEDEPPGQDAAAYAASREAPDGPSDGAIF